MEETQEPDQHEEVTINNYVPGSALAAIDAKIAHMDALFKRLLQSAAKALATEMRGGVPPPDPSQKSLIQNATVEDLCSHLKKCKNVIVLTGAGISTSAGIPDFRTPGTGLYDNVERYLQQYNISNAQQLFSYNLFTQDPEPFYALARELKYPNESIQPTVAHYFIKLLSDKNVLLRNYTQNIDMLQSITGIPDENVFEVHGSFSSGTCMSCKAKYNKEQVKEAIMSGKVPKCTKKVAGVNCGGVMKPDIVMFGEPLPQEYLCKVSGDQDKCDLLIVMGTSLQVGPVNKIPNDIPRSTPRLLINMEEVCTDSAAFSDYSAPLFFFSHPDNKTDVFMEGDINKSIRKLAIQLGWWDELKVMADVDDAQFEEETMVFKTGKTPGKFPAKEVKRDDGPHSSNSK